MGKHGWPTTSDPGVRPPRTAPVARRNLGTAGIADRRAPGRGVAGAHGGREEPSGGTVAGGHHAGEPTSAGRRDRASPESGEQEYGEQDPGQSDFGEQESGEQDPGQEDDRPPFGEQESGEQDRGQEDDRPPFGEHAGVGGRRPAGAGLQWRVARSAALVFLGVALAVGAALFLVRSPEPSAAAMSVQLDGTPQGGSGTAPDAGARNQDGGDASTSPASAGPAEGSAEGGGSALPTGSPGAGPPGGSSAGAGGTVLVYVTGAVVAPGVVEADAGSRLADVVELAGGARPDADLEVVNLAARPVDGQHLHILAVGEEPRPGQTDASGVPPVQGAAAAPGDRERAKGGTGTGGTGTGGAGTGGTGTGGAGGSVPGPGSIDINTATLAEIESLPRVGPVLGQRILDWRQEHGPFLQAADIDAVPGIGPALLEGLLPLIVVR